MPGCPQCGKVWPDSYARCPDDGSALSAAVSHGAAAPQLAHDGGYDEDLPAGSFAGDYRIEKKIGEGGMGSVYGARHPLIGKRAAIKVIRRELSGNPEAVDRFVLEAQSVNQIGHPNIVDVFGFGQLADGRSYFVMEWLEGESLRERLQRPLQFPDALEMLEAIAKALEAAHDAGVLHRDLKPDNVFLQNRKGEKPTVKLLDFGLAKLTGQGDGRMDRTRTGVVMGTPLYLSPEQAKGQKVDAATDVYSLGAMAYEMLSGHVPFKADSAVEIMAMHIATPVTPLVRMASWLPSDVDQLVLQMLEKDASRRPTTAQVRERLAAIRARSSGAIAMPVNPSTQGAPYTPQSYGTPSPYPSTTPGLLTQPPHTPMPATPTPPPMAAMQSNMGQPLAPKRSKLPLIIMGVLAVGGVGAAVVMATRKKEAAPAVANKEQTQAETPTPVPTPTPPPVDNNAGVGSAEGSAAGSATEHTIETPPEAPPETPPDKPEAPPEKPNTTPEKPVVKPPAAAKTGRVVVVFDGPPRAQIFIDGRAQGRETGGRVSFELPPGDHTIRVQAKGYKPGVANVHLDAGGSRDVKLTLEKKKQSVNSVHNPFDD